MGRTTMVRNVRMKCFVSGIWMGAFYMAGGGLAMGVGFTPPPQTRPIPIDLTLSWTQGADDHPFDYIPEEPSIPNFPKPIDVHETDLKVLMTYYEDVSNAYESWGQRKIEEAQFIQTAMHRQNQDLVKRRFKGQTTTNRITPQALSGPHMGAGYSAGLGGAQMRSVSYYQASYLSLRNTAEESMQKALFYRDLADAIGSVMDDMNGMEGEDQPTPHKTNTAKK